MLQSYLGNSYEISIAVCELTIVITIKVTKDSPVPNETS